ncbi:MAG: hypothetical protein WA208_12740 [Thermoanaerobaculia bacterium]
MTVYIDRIDAPLLPSRHRFALFRLIAYLRLRAAPTGRDRARLYFVDPDQSSVEQYGVAIWATLTVAAFSAAALETIVPLWIASLAAIPIAALLLQVPVVLVGFTILPLMERLIGRPIRRIRFESRLMMLLLSAGAMWSLQSDGWERYVGWHFVVVMAANALAAATLHGLHGQIERLERHSVPE